MARLEPGTRSLPDGLLILCGSILHNDGVGGAMCALDNIGRNKCLERYGVRSITCPKQGHEILRPNPLADEVTHCQLVAENNIEWVEVKKFSPLDFLSVTYRKD